MSLLRPLAFVLSLSPLVCAQGIVLRSGQALPGQPDPNVRCLIGPQSGPFGGPFTSPDFISARTGPNAQVLTSIAGGWPNTLPNDATARWINSPANSTTLYAIDFQFTRSGTSAVFLIDFVADDLLGVAPSVSTNAVEGIYLNGVAIPYSGGIGTYYQSTRYETQDLLPNLVNGTNTLYLYLHNTGGRAGLLFRAELAQDRATSQTFGSGCAGANGKPYLVMRSGRPAIGSNVQIELYNTPVTGSSWLILGVSRQLWLGQPLPLDLTALGMPGCSAHVSVDDILPTTNLGGVCWLGFPMPNANVLIGLQVYLQGLVADPGAGNTAGTTVSDAVAWTIGT